MTATFQHSLEDSLYGSMADTDIHHFILLPYLKNRSFALSLPECLCYKFNDLVTEVSILMSVLRGPLTTFSANINFRKSVFLGIAELSSVTSAMFIAKCRHSCLENLGIFLFCFVRVRTEFTQNIHFY